MSQIRPGGLTALAVINFISALMLVFSIFSILVFMAILSNKFKMREQDVRQITREIERTTDKESLKGVLMTGIAFNSVSVLLLTLSGIGYLKQKRVLGRVVGNSSALVSIVATVVTARLLPETAGGGFTMSTIMGLIYPLFTLLLLNFTFREDFPN